MRLVTTDAIVLRTYNLAESDRIVLCLTRSSGLIRGVAKGARRMKSRFGASLEPFTLIKLSFHEKENRDLVSLSSCEILKSHFNLSAQVETEEVLAYMGELITEFAPPHEPDERLFRMLSACIDALASTSGTERTIMRYFEVWLLRLAGLFPDLRNCAQCGSDIDPAGDVFLDAELSPQCRNCRPANLAGSSQDLLAFLNATQRTSPIKLAQTFALTDRQDAELSNVTHRLIARAIDRRPRTLVAANR